ncbi:hypothetical protein ACP70R_019296 [Stipagrostis hirtigluma subsp. patula]
MPPVAGGGSELSRSASSHCRRHYEGLPHSQDRRLLPHQGHPHRRAPQVPPFHRRRPPLVHLLLPQRKKLGVLGVCLPSLFLVLDETVAEGAEVKAQYQFCLADEAGALGDVLSFKSRRGWGFADFIKGEDLEKHLINDDSFTVRCDIVVVKEFRAVVEPGFYLSGTFVSVPPSDLHQHLGKLLLTGRAADVVFEVGGETFAAHRCVLAACSPVFKAELLGTI